MDAMAKRWMDRKARDTVRKDQVALDVGGAGGEIVADAEDDDVEGL